MNVAHIKFSSIPSPVTKTSEYVYPFLHLMPGLGLLHAVVPFLEPAYLVVRLEGAVHVHNHSALIEAPACVPLTQPNAIGNNVRKQHLKFSKIWEVHVVCA